MGADFWNSLHSIQEKSAGFAGIFFYRPLSFPTNTFSYFKGMLPPAEFSLPAGVKFGTIPKALIFQAFFFGFRC